MAEFQWKGFAGTESHAGVIQAESEREAAHLLRKRGLIITRLYQDKSSGKVSSLNSLLASSKPENKPLKNEDIVLFTKKLSTMVRAGLTVSTALSLMVDQVDKPNVAKLCKTLLDDIESGQSVSEALSKHSNFFDVVYINLVRAGEASGRLEFFLDKLQENLEKSAQLRSTIKKALFYPIVLMTVTIVVVGIMLVFVVPIFAELFSASGAELPALTAGVMAVSEFVQDPARGGVVAGLIAAGVFGFRRAMKNNFKFRRNVNYLTLKIPLFGDLIVKSAMAKVAMIMANLTAAGTPILDAVDIAQSSMANMALSESLGNVRDGLYQGRQISTLFSEEDSIPPTFSQLLSVGEETGNMEDMYGSLSNYYQEEVDGAVSAMTALLEPVMIVFMGLTVGFIIVAMYLPIFSMGDIVG